MENVNKQQPIYISLTEFGYGSQELNPKTVRLHLAKKVGRNNRDKDLKNAYSFFKRRSRCQRVVGSYKL